MGFVCVRAELTTIFDFNSVSELSQEMHFAFSRKFWGTLSETHNGNT